MSLRPLLSRLHRGLGRLALSATPSLNGDDFLARHGLPLPVPPVEGALGAAARRGFPARRTHRRMDLLVCFSMGDWEAGARGSRYFDPRSPWFNVFYGGYGIRSHKPDGSAWGYTPEGRPEVREVVEVAALDYDFLTAGQLGCPPEKLCFALHEHSLSHESGWDVLEAAVTAPSALHRLRDAHRPNPAYYLAFGLPDASLVGEAGSYAPVRMRGRLYFRRAAPRITLAWGALCPDTREGQALLQRILAAMAPHYGLGGARQGEVVRLAA